MSFETNIETLQTKLLRLRYELAAETFRIKAARLHAVLFGKAFDPNQPRVPAGSPDGGEWTSTGGGGGTNRTRLAQTEENENPRRPLLEETLDGAAEVRIARFEDARQDIRRLEPNNPRLPQITPTGYAPGKEAIDEVENELEAARDRISARIASGHAFRKHAREFNTNSPVEFQAIVRAMISDPRVQVRDLLRGRTSFYYNPKNILVIVDPNSRDGGTMYRPEGRQSYVDNELKTGGNQL